MKRVMRKPTPLKVGGCHKQTHYIKNEKIKQGRGERKDRVLRETSKTEVLPIHRKKYSRTEKG